MDAGVRWLGWLAVAGIASTVSGADAPQPIERWDRAVFLCTDKPADAKPEPWPNDKAAFASGFLVSHQQQLYLVTAKHAANDVQVNSRLLYLAHTGESRWLQFGAFRGPAGGNPWVVHPKADVAAMRMHLDGRTDEQKKSFPRLAIPLDRLVESPPRRTTAVDIVGFPLSLGTIDCVTPIVCHAFLASREVSVPGKWENERFLLASPAAGRGTSGGPVFLAEPDAQSAAVLGMYAGLIQDDSGSKLAKIVPARHVRETIQAFPPPAAGKVTAR